jgi:hypothetical protein
LSIPYIARVVVLSSAGQATGDVLTSVRGARTGVAS